MAENAMTELTAVMPALTRSASSRARLPNTDEPRPKLVALARRRPSSADATLTIGITGPKVSSFITSMSSSTSTRTVGWMKLPTIASGPPVRTLAPRATASSRWRRTIPTWADEVMAPRWPSSPPTLTLPTSATTLSTNCW
jgi:hypothetical protein